MWYWFINNNFIIFKVILYMESVTTFQVKIYRKTSPALAARCPLKQKESRGTTSDIPFHGA